MLATAREVELSRAAVRKRLVRLREPLLDGRKSKRRVSDAELLESYAVTANSAATAREFKMNAATVRYHLKRLGALKPQPMKVSDQQILDAFAEHGPSARVVAKAVNLHKDTVLKRLELLGVQRLSHKRYSEEETQRVKLDYDRYRSVGCLRDLAAEIGRSYASLVKKGQDLGLADRAYPRKHRRTWAAMSDEDYRALFDCWTATGLPASTFCRTEGIPASSFRAHMRAHFLAEYDCYIDQRKRENTSANAGRDFEADVAQQLRRKGFTVFPSWHSRGAADLLLVGPRGALYAVQIQLSDDMTPSKWNSFYRFSSSIGALPLLATASGRMGFNLWQLLGLKTGKSLPQPKALIEITPEGPIPALASS